MARRTFFSFNYKDVWRVNQIRSMTNVIGTAAAGFEDASIWEEAKKKGEAAIKRMIDNALKNTSVTVVCVTYGTASRKYIKYEVDKSLDRGNGLVAVQIHDLKDQNGNTCSAGACPAGIEENGFKYYKFSNKERLAAWIEEAAKKAGK
jgi:Thoeris protein ThsB, TIR-like domain